ncbi:hypothetical protein GBZ48_22190 [Azospirillum melinis]|uniref:Glycosyl transferase n=1 Tax=Azospirillum melinis TaxID=328839 RepID=A0ABX2KL29_9PROT|nr:hypothetical protein [Azospirillum melinis]MBP2307519.1 hypothetical protein [Azospirillum melinis]NUB01964.1 hypothetical protein [Azospirillum melinis]
MDRHRFQQVVDGIAAALGGDPASFQLNFRIIEAGGDRRQLYTVLALLIGQIGDEAEKWRLADALIDCRPDDGELYLALADRMAFAGMGVLQRDPGIPRQGIALLHRALEHAAPSPLRLQIHANLSFLYNEAGCPELAETHGRAAAGSQNVIFHLWLAEALFRQGKYVRDGLCAIDLSSLALRRAAWVLAKADEVLPLPRTEASVLLVSVDAAYFKRYAAAQILNLHELGSAVTVHYHIINGDDEVDRLIGRLREAVGTMPLVFTHETWALRGDAFDKPHYASSRFLVAPEAMLRHKANVIVCDADVLFREKPEDIVRAAADGDVLHTDYRGEPLCSRYNASFVCFRHGPAGYLTLLMIADFLRTNFERFYLWMIDQVALFVCVQRAAQLLGSEMTHAVWPDAVLPARPGDELPLILTGALSGKHGNSPYSEKRDDILRANGF